MTVLPLRVEQRDDGWWVTDANCVDEAGTYDKKSEADDARRGLTRFYQEHPEYLPNLAKDRNMSSIAVVAEPLVVSRDEAVHMFTTLGLKTASTWPKPRMEEKITTIRDAYDPDTKLTDPAAQTTFNEIVSALAAGRAVTLVPNRLAAAVPPVVLEPAPVPVPSAPVAESAAPVEQTSPSNGNVPAPRRGRPRKSVAAPVDGVVPVVPRGLKVSPALVPSVCGAVWKKYGLVVGAEMGVTDAMVDEICQRLGTYPKRARILLARAWHTVQGFNA